MCIQETKVEIIDMNICYSLLGTNEFKFVFKHAVGRSGRILMIWDNKVFTVQRIHTLSFAMWMEGE